MSAVYALIIFTTGYPPEKWPESFTIHSTYKNIKDCLEIETRYAKALTQANSKFSAECRKVN